MFSLSSLLESRVYCTCGQCLIDSESKRKFNKLRLDALSIPNYVIKEGPNRCLGEKSENKLKSLSIQINTDDGIPLQAH